MQRLTAILFVVLCLFLAASSHAQDSIPASEILKVWEKTTIKNASFRFEEINRRFVDLSPEDKDRGLIGLSSGQFWFSQSVGMKLDYGEPKRGASNHLRGINLTISKQEPQLPYTVNQYPAGERTSNAAIKVAFQLWLDPGATRFAKTIRDLGDTKLDITKDEKGNDRIKIHAKNNLTLAKEFDWRIIRVDQLDPAASTPRYAFEFGRSKQDELVLKSAMYSLTLQETNELHSHCELSISDLKTEEVTEKDLSINIPTPARVIDYTVTPANDYYLRKDGSKTPFSMQEHDKILEEIKAAKAKPAKE